MAKPDSRWPFALLFLLCCVNGVFGANLPQQEEWRMRLDLLKSTIDRLSPDQFYNYSLVCGGKEYDARVTLTSVDETIPRDRVKFIRDTYVSPSERAQKCPKWSSTAGPGFGALEKLSIDENTPLGTKVFTLVAEDAELLPIYYFVRNVESEPPTTSTPLFRIEPKKLANNWVGEVIVNAKIDYETRKSYQYLTYAYDGFNLIERYSTIEILDTDDEPTSIDTQSIGYNATLDRFVFNVPENASIGSIINPNAPIIFKDVDTPISQLKVKLVENGSSLSGAVPFTINTDGEIKLIVNLDYETRDVYLIKVIAEDRSGGQVEKDIEIRVIDVADLAPEFLHPAAPIVENDQDLPSNYEFLSYKIDHVTQFFENKLGPVFNISALSRNARPLGNITYEILPLGQTTSMDMLNTHFRIKHYNETPEDYVFAYLDCVTSFSLDDREELDIAFVLRAKEADQLYTDKRVLLRIINGDLCAPKFDKPVYEFFVVENIKEILEPIYVTDCDNGVNGKMFLSTTSADFHSKLDEVYRNAKLGIEMKRTYDYEEMITINGTDRVEFDIIVKSSPASLKLYEARAHVIVHIQDLNEFVPRFVKPASTHVKKNGDRVEDQKTFFFNAPENKDFTLTVLAEDSDHIGLGQLDYVAKFVDESNNLNLIHNYSRETNEFNITIPGRYISTDSRVPIIFIVQVADVGEKRLTNEIIIYVKPYSDTLKPIYFEFDKYEYALSETSKQIPFAVKLINDNTQLNRSSIKIDEVSDVLDLFTHNLEDPFITQQDLIDTSLVESSTTTTEALFENELKISLMTSRGHMSMDELFVANNFSDTYEYKLRAWLAERPEFNTTVTVHVKFVDSNQHKPYIRNLDRIQQHSVINESVIVIDATISEDYLLTSQMINIDGDFSLLEYSDLDFSDKYGLDSLHFTLNDTRFFVENKYSMPSSLFQQPRGNKTNSYVSPLIKTVSRNGDGSSEPVFVRLTEPVIWLNLTCEDNYFGRRVNPQESQWHSFSILIRVTIQEARQQVPTDPSLDFVEISIPENFVGLAGNLTNTSVNVVNYTSFDAQTKEQVAYLLQHFSIDSNNSLRVIKPFDFERDQHKLEFYATSSSSSGKDRLRVKIIIKDENDQVPAFVQTEYKFYIKEKTSVDSLTIGKLYAIDLDTNEELNFTINENNEASQIFKLVNLDGFDGLQGLYGTSLQLIKDLPDDHYHFNIQVKDLTGHSSECNVTVEVINNNSQIISGLRWLNETYEASVNESSPEDTPLIQIQAEAIMFDNTILSNDEKNSSQLNNLTIGYMLINPSGYYKINSTTGLITCTNKSVDREEIVRNRILEQSYIYAQAYLQLDVNSSSSSIVSWSPIARVHVEIQNLNDQPPVFLAPLNNSTQIKLGGDDTTEQVVVYTFQALDLDKEDFEFRLVGQYREFVEDPAISLPFQLNATSGNLTLDLSLIDQMLLVSLVNNTDVANDLVTVRLDVMAIDSHNNSANCSLYVNIPVSLLFNEIQDSLVIQIESSSSSLNRINESYYSISELMPPGQTFGQVRMYMNVSETFDEKEKEELVPVTFLNATWSGTTPDAHMFIDIGNNNKEKTLRLIRPLDYSLVQSIGFSIQLDSTNRRELTILVNDTNNHAPRLRLSTEETNKLGGNLLVVSVDDFSPELKRISIQSSSTPRPVPNFIPAIPEQGLPSMTIPVHYNTMELDHNTKRLEEFNSHTLISAYEIIDLDANNQFNVSFDNTTSQEILDHFTVTSNGTHVLFEKKKLVAGNESSSDVEAAIDNDKIVRLLNETRYKFGVDLTDGVNSEHYSGELVTINAQQIQRLLVYKQDNGHFSGSLYRYTDNNVEVEIKPRIIVENQFPFDLHLRLVGDDSQYFSLVPNVVLAGADQPGAVQVRLVLKDSLAKNQDKLDSALRFKLQLTTNSSHYLNQLLGIIADLDIYIRLLSYDGYQPRISTIEPASGVITLKEGVYHEEKIASVSGKTRGGNDPNRLQYFLIGDNNLVKINPDTGDIFLSGRLDAEQQQLIVFYAFVRDIDYKPLGRNSELVKLEILVSDVNEYEPTISINRPTIDLDESENAETDDEHDEIKIINDLMVQCVDRDVNATLNVTLHSVGYVHQYDPNILIDLNHLGDKYKHSLRDMFELITSDVINSSMSDKTNRASHVSYLPSRLRLEKLYKPWSYLIRLDFACTDGQYQSRAHTLIHVVDKNNHAPTFTKPVESIERDETQLVERIYKCEASDLDGGSPRYGNASIRYHIESCSHSHAYDITINEETGELYSNLRVNLSPEEIVASRKLVHNNSTGTHRLVSNLNKIVCVIGARDGGNLTGYQNLSIHVRNVNSNAPMILSDLENKENEIELEVHEGPQSRGLVVTTFVVYDMDGARNLRCAFDNGMSSKDLFIILTETDLNDENMAICTIKVCADCKIEHRVGQSFILLDVVVEDKIPAPVAPNNGLVRKTVRIKVIPSNSNPPQFANGQEEVFYMLDSNRPGTQIGTVFATDLDTFSPDEIHYELYSTVNDTSVSHLNKFELRKLQSESRKNVWSSVGLFTRDKLLVDESPYRIIIRAYDTPLSVMTSSTHFAEKIMIVHILNQGSKSVWVNGENGAPVDMYETSLLEERDENEHVLRIKAVIPDMYFNQNQIITDYIEYSILAESPDIINPFYSINQTTGQVTTTSRRLDYEEKNAQLMSQMRNFRVQVVSKDGHFRYATSVRVNLIDINDNSPQFDDSSLQINVYENTTRRVREFVTRIKASDSDSQENGVVRYSVWSEGDYLEIDQETGDLYVLNTTHLDREQTPRLIANLTAYNPDGVKSTSVNLTINLLDINDNTPQFVVNTTTVKIEENTVGFSMTLRATDPDNLFNGTVYYYLDTSLNSNLSLRSFQIDPILGVLSQSMPLDYETIQRVDLVVCVSDQGTPEQLKSCTTILIETIDINDNTPEFDPATTPRRATIIESAKPGHRVIQLVAKDNDLSAQFNQTMYSLKNQQGLNSTGNYEQVKGSLFEIDSESGWIRVGGEDAKLDYSVYKEYLVQVVASDKNDSSLASQVFNLTVYVEPSRDKQPIFESTGQHHLSRRGAREVNSTVLYARSLDESTPNDYVVDVIKAKDPNQYGINYFIDSVEEVFYNKSANVSEMNEETGQMVTKNYTSRVNTNGLFKIGTDDGILKTNQTRSNYQADFYMIKIRAVSKLNASLSNVIDLVVNLDKESDSLFPKRVYEVSVDENLPIDHVVLALRPKRVDERRKLRYRINDVSSSSDHWFQLDYETGLLKTNSTNIDCELADEVLLSVDVNDLGNENNQEVFIENLLVKIKVNDLNDQWPQWDLSFDYTVSMSEDTNETINSDRFVTKFRANDLDRTEYNSLTDYEIVGVKNGQLGWFRLETNSNDKSSNLYKQSGVELDREATSVIFVRVRAFNVNDKSKYVERDVIINLKDENDHTPVIASAENTVFSLYEDTPLFKPFANISAYDLDEPNTPNSNLVYQIVNTCTVTPLPITLDPLNGQLSLNKSLDYDKGQRQYTLNVSVSDTSSTSPKSTMQTFTVKVINVNNNSPQFVNLSSSSSSNECVISVYESAQVDQEIYKFHAVDLDQDVQQFEFNLSQVTLLNGSLEFKNPFVINSTSGELKLAKHLDREWIDTYLITVTVFDQAINGVRLNTTTRCRVQVLDVNDNKPVFISTTNSEFKILPLVNERTQIGWFGATDADLGSNATLSYSLVNTFHSLFEIDAETSHVFINLRGKQVFLNTTYDLEIVARDHGNMGQLESSPPLRARVLIDDNYFKFKQSDNDNLKLNVANLVYVDENVANDTFVARVNVVNSIESVLQIQPDSEESSSDEMTHLVLTYKLLTCNDTFKIDNRTGEVRVLDSSKLDYEQVKEFVVQIECTEINRLHVGQVKYRLGRINMLVKLKNLNDNPVSFDRPNYTSYTIDENSFSLPQPVTGPLVQISDPDLSLGETDAEISVHLEGDEAVNTFRLVRLARLVYRVEATQAFDYETKTRYEFNIVANDGLHVTRVPCGVSVNDLNDNDPIFEDDERDGGSGYVFNVNENAPIGTVIGQVHARDLDRTLVNNQTLYKFNSQRDSDVFSLDRVSGVLSVIDSSKLDREKHAEYNVTVIAYNANDVSRKDETHVLVKLNDVNDQTPTFDKPIYQIYLREKLRDLPHLMLNLTARDGDLGENGTIVYELAQPSELFSLDARTGQLFLTAYLDADATTQRASSSFVLHVRARDEGKTKSLSSECTVQINLIDVNDHAPEFKQPLQSTFYFDENDSSLVHRDTGLFTVVCQDPDSSKSEIEYSLVFDNEKEAEEANRIFSIQKYKDTGRVRINKPFDYEQASEYKFRVKCVDKGVMIDLNNLNVKYPSSQMSEMDFVIRVNDLDDNEPIFHTIDLEMNKNVSETLVPESLVAIVPIPNDVDSWSENKQVRYKILSVNDNTAVNDVTTTFRLNDTTGELFLAQELDTRRVSKYTLVIKASSRSNWQYKRDDRSILTLHLHVVADKLLIEFTQNRYFVDFNLLQDHNSDAKLSFDHTNRSLFYSRAHLINRKPRNPLRYQVASVEVNKLNSMQQLTKSVVDQIIRIDPVDGRIFVNASQLESNGFVLGDSIVINLIANLYAKTTSSQLINSNIIENSLTRLVVNLTGEHTSILMGIHGIPMQHIFLSYLNPMSKEYIERKFSSMGVRSMVQDLIINNNNENNSKNNVSILMQVTSRGVPALENDQRQTLNLELDTFMSFLKNNSMRLDNFLDQDTVSLKDSSPDKSSLKMSPESSESDRFYHSWLFWLLFIISLLLVVILIMFLFCIKLARKQNKTAKKLDNLLVDYPPGVNPMYDDEGFDFVNNKKRRRGSSSGVGRVMPVDLRYTSDYEDQELEMKIDETDDQ